MYVYCNIDTCNVRVSDMEHKTALRDMFMLLWNVSLLKNNGNIKYTLYMSV